MTDQQKNQNELIAQFDGWRKSEEGSDTWIHQDSTGFNSEAGVFIYHISWNSLIRVWKKIHEKLNELSEEHPLRTSSFHNKFNAAVNDNDCEKACVVVSLAIIWLKEKA